MTMPLFQQRPAFAAALLAAACLLSATAQYAQEPAATRPEAKFSERLEGDAAMWANDYSVAAALYAKYREEAARAGDKTAEEDAFQRQISALVAAGMSDKAAKALSDFESSFPAASRLDAAELLRADVLLLKGDPNGAAVVCEALARRLPASSASRRRALYTLGLSLEASGDFGKAAEAYSAAYEAAAESPLGRKSFLRMVMNLAEGGDMPKAKDSLLSFPPPADEDAAADLRLLGIFIAFKESGLASVAAAYASMKRDLKEGPRPMAYAVASALGDASLKARSLSEAADFYRDAFLFASGRQEECESLRRTISALEAAGRKEEAANLALKHLELFKGSAHAAEVKLQAARLLASIGRRREAVRLYLELAGDATSPEDRLAGARECARVQIDMQDYAGAADTIRSFFMGGQDSGEGSFLLAELQARQGRHSEAAEAYMKVAGAWKQWRDKALYEALRSHMEAKALDKALGVAELIMREFETGEVRKDATYLRARIFEMKGDLDEASKEYLGFAESFPNHPDFAPRAIYRAARIAFVKGRPQEAERLFSRLAQQYPSNQLAPNALLWRAHALRTMGDDVSADKEAWQLFERYPDSEFSKRAIFSLVASLKDRGDYAKADAALDRLVSKSDGDRETLARAVYEKAAIAVKTQDMYKALQLLGELSERHPDSPFVSEGLCLHGDILKELGDYEQALGRYQKAMERRPGSLLEAACLGGIGDCLFSRASESKDTQKYEGALESYRKLLARKDAPSSFKDMAQFKAGRCLELLGDEAQAMENYKTLIYRFKVASGLGAPPSPLWAVKSAEAVVEVAMRTPSPENVRDAKAALEWLAASNLASPKETAARMETLEKLKFKP